MVPVLVELELETTSVKFHDDVERRIILLLPKVK